tara:strand:+ start:188 stop:481 length:294 start_codon:yes stop_codon:yes gene_type:complete
MLVNIVSKIIIILALTTLFLFFKNSAKELDLKIIETKNNIKYMNQILVEKKNTYALDLNKIIKNKSLNSVTGKTITIENYLNKNMTIVRVDYVKKSD